MAAQAERGSMPTSRADRLCAAQIRGRRAQDAGFTYLGVLLAIALIGVGLTGASEIWGKRAARERLARMDAIGAEYVSAIAAYRQGTPGIVVNSFPRSFGSLIQDSRFLTVRRYLRREYPNPFTGRADWEIVPAPDGGILGIRAHVNVDGQDIVREYVYRPPVPLQTKRVAAST
jgi:type II secretory pathway pseudopilin PulG